MVARLMPEQMPVKITPENHPENAPQEPVEPKPTASLGWTIGLGIVCSLVGMTIGTAALSTSFQADNPLEVLCMVPLIGAAASILGGWVGAFFFMVRSDSQKSGHR